MGFLIQRNPLFYNQRNLLFQIQRNLQLKNQPSLRYLHQQEEVTAVVVWITKIASPGAVPPTDLVWNVTTRTVLPGYQMVHRVNVNNVGMVAMAIPMDAVTDPPANGELDSGTKHACPILILPRHLFLLHPQKLQQSLLLYHRYQPFLPRLH